MSRSLGNIVHYQLHFRKALALLLLSLITTLSHAQTPSILLLSADSSYKLADGFVQLHGMGLVGANSLDNLFLKKSVLGGRLEDGHLDDLSSRMKDQNRAGFDIVSGLDFLNFRDTMFNHAQWGLRVGLSTNYHGALSFNRDLYNLVYRGNARFAGDTAHLAPLAAQYQAYQKFSVGIFNKHTLSSVTASLVAGQSYQSLIVTEGDLYTSPNGDSLALTYSGDYLQSDTAKSGWANGSGIGIAFDFDFNLPLQDGKGVISIAVRDVGFIVWNQLGKHYTFDSLTTWQGINVNDVFQLTTDTLDFPHLRDSLHYHVSRSGFVAPLPASVHLRFSRFFSSRSFYEAGISIWPNRAAVPFIYGGLNHFLSDHLLVSERVSFGGYSRWGIGAEIQWMPRGSWLIRAGSNHLEGFISDRAHGRDVYFTLAKTFRGSHERQGLETE
jgi:hypothetical protein